MPQNKNSSTTGIQNLNQGNFSFGFVEETNSTDIPLIGANRLYCSYGIESPFLIGNISMLDVFAQAEKQALYTNLQKRWAYVETSYIHAKNTKYKFRFDVGLYDVTNQLSPSHGESNKNAKELNIGLVSEPLYSALHKRRLNKCYTNTKLSDIIIDLLTNKKDSVGLTDKYINVLPFGAEDPIIPQFIVPYWTTMQALQYLANYCPNGPLKFFYDYNAIEGNWKFVVAPLGSLLSGKLGTPPGTGKYIIARTRVDEDGNISPYILRPNYVITGTSSLDIKSYLGGESVLHFDYFSNKNNWPVQLSPEFASYRFETQNKNKDRGYMTPIAGDYKHGSGDTARLGDYLLYETDPTSDGSLVMNNHTRQWGVDVDPKNLVEIKMKNRFNNRFYQQLCIKASLTPSIVIRPGLVYELELPSINKNPDGTHVLDTALSGKYLLTKVEHVLAHLGQTPAATGLNYDCIGYFVRTGLSSSLNGYFEKAEKKEVSDKIKPILSNVKESTRRTNFKNSMTMVRNNNIYRY